MKPLVSWLMTVYNCKNVDRALESMLVQTYTNFEVIIVLEFSTDRETTELCERYAKQDERIHIIHNTERLGIPKSLNVGLKYCKGKYIARMDADDYSYPDRLEKQVAYMESHPQIGLVGGNARVINEITGASNIRYNKVPDGEQIKAMLLFGMCFMNSSTMFRNTENLRYPEVRTEDYAIFSSMITTTPMEILPDIVLDYYTGENNSCIKAWEDVRKCSAVISRTTIQKELGLDVRGYHNSFFGWREHDAMPEKPWDFLKEGYFFYQSVLKANEEKKVFEQNALKSVINTEWLKTVRLAFPYILFDLYQCFEKISEKRIEDCFKRLDGEAPTMKQMIIYGTGFACEKWIEAASEQQLANVLCFCDSNPAKWGTVWHGKKIIAPEELKEQSFEYISIASFDYEEEIKKKILELGVSEEKVQPLPLQEKAKRFYNEYRKNLSE